MEKYVKLTTSKERITTSVFVVAVIAILLHASSLHLEYDSAYTPLMDGCLFFIGLSIAVKIETKGWVSVLWNGLLIVLAIAFSYTTVNILMKSTGSYPNSNNYYIEECILSFLICLFFYFIFLILTARPRLTIILGNLFWFIFGMIAYIVNAFRGEIFLFPDIFSVKTALDVAGNYHFQLTGDIIVSFILLTTTIIFSLNATWKIQSLKKSIIIRSGTLLFSVILFCSFWYTNVDKYYYSWNPQKNEYLYSFALSAKMFFPQPPKNYNPDNLNTYIPNETIQIANSDTKNLPINTEIYSDKPNIIAIMNESFSDLSVLGNFETNVDYMPFIHSLEENTIKGNTYVSVFGGGTCDSEYSFLTGNTTAYLPPNTRPYEKYVKSPSPSLSSTLENQGYNTIAMHPGAPDTWHRQEVYSYFGFNQYFFFSDFQNPTMTRNFHVSDQSTYEKVISEYEKGLQSNQQQFIFDVTITNHGAYNLDASDLEPVTITGHEGEFPQTEQYLSLMKKSDESFESLVNYFSNREEPVIILLFGDHQGYVDDSFYEFLKGKPMDEWNVNELQQRQITPFIIWANYDIPEMTIDKLSVNYLAPLLLKVANLEMTDYDRYLLDLAKDLPVINSVGIIDKENQYYKKGESSPYDEKILKYQQFLYNNIIDTENRKTELYTLPSDK